jgi:hypothetical protein
LNLEPKDKKNIVPPKTPINLIAYGRQNAMCNGFLCPIGDGLGIRTFLNGSEKLPIKPRFGANTEVNQNCRIERRVRRPN